MMETQIVATELDAELAILHDRYHHSISIPDFKRLVEKRMRVAADDRIESGGLRGEHRIESGGDVRHSDQDVAMSARLRNPFLRRCHRVGDRPSLRLPIARRAWCSQPQKADARSFVL